MKNSNMKNLMACTVLLPLLLVSKATDGLCDDPWKALRNLVGTESEIATKKVKESGEDDSDPWAKLRAIYLPFSEEQESEAFENSEVGKKVSGHFHKSLKAFEHLIEEASKRFEIPKHVIAGLIMVESSGNPKAKAKTSSAKGLTQTIASTFREARAGLLAQGVVVKNDPYDPRASIMAGSWYLNEMYKRALADGKPGVGNRKKTESWKHPLRYYYAGPSGGRKDGDIVIIYAGGKKVVVNKKAYSQKVMRWAKIMEKYG
jgi:hypothetical protein